VHRKFTSGKGFSLNIWTVSTSGRLAEYFAIASIFRFLVSCVWQKKTPVRIFPLFNSLITALI
jgi:hypothetical protein